MRVALYGGSFNPVHRAHIYICEEAIRLLSLDLLILIPSHTTVGKDPSTYAHPHHRVNMLRLVLPPECTISDFELSQGIPVETIVTLRHFRSLYPDDELFFLMGEDSLATIHTWECYREFDSLVNLVVFRRSSPDHVTYPKGLRVMWVDNPWWDISSSQFRDTGDPSLLDEKVVEYIGEHKIYNF